jgi:plastocyanin
MASSDPSLTGAIHAVNEGGYYGETHHWSPAEVTVAAGGTVTISNPTAVRHGVHWINSPAQPVCDGKVPVGTTEAMAGTLWSGECKFAQSGAYTFYCTVHGSAMSGTIVVPGTPKAATEQPAEVTQTGASLRGNVNPQGEATQYRFEYGTSTVSEHTTGAVGVGSTDFNDHAVSAPLTGLSPSTQYHVELVATYGASGTVLGGEQVFTTPAVRAPAVTTGQATAVTPTGATLGGAVSPEGLETTYRFEYGLTPSYGSVTPSERTGPEGVNHAASAPVSGLVPNTLYHFRLLAENKSGSTAGEDQKFTTASPSPSSSPPPGLSPPMIAAAATAAFSSMAPSSLESSLGPLLVGGPSLRASQRGSSVRGSVKVSPAGAGGRLEVELSAQNATLAKSGRSARVRVGRLVRSALHAGTVSFVVPLNARAKGALHRHRRLALTVKIVLQPLHGSAVTITRSVVVHA